MAILRPTFVRSCTAPRNNATRRSKKQGIKLTPRTSSYARVLNVPVVLYHPLSGAIAPAPSNTAAKCSQKVLDRKIRRQKRFPTNKKGNPRVKHKIFARPCRAAHRLARFHFEQTTREQQKLSHAVINNFPSPYPTVKVVVVLIMIHPRRRAKLSRIAVPSIHFKIDSRSVAQQQNNSPLRQQQTACVHNDSK